MAYGETQFSELKNSFWTLTLKQVNKTHFRPTVMWHKPTFRWQIWHIKFTITCDNVVGVKDIIPIYTPKVGQCVSRIFECNVRKLGCKQQRKQSKLSKQKVKQINATKRLHQINNTSYKLLDNWSNKTDILNTLRCG